MITQKELERLLDDIKHIAKAVKVMGDENDQIKRNFAKGLVEDLVNRLYNDMNELKENKTTISNVPDIFPISWETWHPIDGIWKHIYQFKEEGIIKYFTDGKLEFSKKEGESK